MKFNSWLEQRDEDFMSDEQKLLIDDPNVTGVKDHPFPIHSFDMERMTNLLLQRQINQKLGNSKFIGDVQWGEGSGAIRINFGTKYDFSIERLQEDLEGNYVWVTKRSYSIDKNNFSGREDYIVNEILDVVTEIDQLPLDAPKNKFEDFYRLVTSVANKVSRTANIPLIYDSVKKVNNNYYIIVFEVRGQGVEAPDHRRVEEVLIELFYDQKKGIVKMIGTQVESPVSQRKWEIMPMDYDSIFMPSQSRDEIVEAISTMYKYY